jgi:microcystin-dependent protein
MSGIVGEVGSRSGVVGLFDHATLPAGMIAPFGSTTVPDGWLACDGSTVSRSTYSVLFSAISTTWGTGDGSSTFHLPDLEGAFLRGTGSNATHNMADGSDFAGPSVGSFENDQMQGHGHWIGRTNQANSSTTLENGAIYISGTSGSSYGISETTRAAEYRLMAHDIVEYADGSPREGDETRPFNAGVKYCIKY